MANIMEIISGESFIIGDIIEDDGSVNGVPFSSEYYCHAKVITATNMCSDNVIIATRQNDNAFSIKLPPEKTAMWDGKVTIIITVENFEPYTDSDGKLVTDQGTSISKEKVYVRAEKFC